MTTLVNKIEHLIKREKKSPECKKKDDSTKSSSQILTELFSAFNADPPKIEEVLSKKSKKSKKKHKKEKKKRSRSSSSNNSDDSEYAHKRKKRKKIKVKKCREPSPCTPRSLTPPRILLKEPIKIKSETEIKCQDVKNEVVKPEPQEIKKESVVVKVEDTETKNIDGVISPVPCSPKLKLESDDLRLKLDSKKTESSNTDSDKIKGKIQIKNLKFSTVFEETVKKAEEEARKRKEKCEEGEISDSTSSSDKDESSNSQFPKSSDLGEILKKQIAEEVKQCDEIEHNVKKKSESEKECEKSSHRSSHRDSSRSRRDGSKSRRDGSKSRRDGSKSRRDGSKSRRDGSKSRRDGSRSHRDGSRSHKSSKSRRSRSGSRKHHRRSKSKSRRKSRTRHRSTSRSRRRSPIKHERHRSRSRHRSRHRSPKKRSERSRSSTGVKLADSEKKRLLEVARRNAINMLKNGAVPAGAAALPPHTRNQVMAAIHSGGKSVDELTDFCKTLSKKEALGELSSVSSNDSGMSENEDTIAFHHPFLVKEKAPIVMNIRGGAPLPVKAPLTVVNKDELRMQFPVSSGTQHREKASEWVPVSPKKDNNMQVAKINSKPAPSVSKAITSSTETVKAAPLALPAPPPVVTPPPVNPITPLNSMNSLPALPAPGPQAYPPGIGPPKDVYDVASMVCQKLSKIRKEQEETELCSTRGFGWSKENSLGQFTGSTGAQILTPRELASGAQAWAKKDQLVRAAPVEGGMGMHLLQKMGWTPGRGLGKEGTGTLQPLLLEVKLDTRGLQAKEEGHNRINRSMKLPRQSRRGSAPLVSGGKHPVSLLGEYCSKQKLGPPEYTLCFECGPDHKKNFLFRVKVAGTEYQPAVASANKKQAKADAAQLALQKLNIVT